jgi:hypothetical protein
MGVVGKSGKGLPIRTCLIFKLVGLEGDWVKIKFFNASLAIKRSRAQSRPACSIAGGTLCVISLDEGQRGCPQ